VAIEGKIGQGKRRYTLGLVMTKLASITRTSVAVTIITMNLIKLLGRAPLSESLAALRTLVEQLRSLTQATTQLYSQLSYHG